MHGDTVFYNINRHINPTNVCVYTYNCKFCSFAAKRDEPHAWQMSLEEVWAKAAEQGGNDVTEFHIVGGLHPTSAEWYGDAARPETLPSAHLKAFTASRSAGSPSARSSRSRRSSND
jgi:aminodeoxyfutalosine synthase